MMDPVSWIDLARSEGATLWTGVPCSYLTPLIDSVISHPDLAYIPAANEGDAVAIAAGAWLGGGFGVALMQNSGLGNAVNPLTSLLHPFKIPMLLLVTWRGQPDGPADEPQHQLMGQITPQLLDLMEIPWEILPSEEQAAQECLRRQTRRAQSEGRCCALIIPKGRFGAHPPTPPLEKKATHASLAVPALEAQLTRREMLEGLLARWTDNDLVVATTGYTGRELYALQDRPQHIYLVGSMGCASSLGLGLALNRPHQRVWVLDGDGALLMRLGALTTVGWVRPLNMVHLVLDNGCHESTGAQATVSPSLDLCQVAAGCGYPQVTRWSEPQAIPESGLTFVHCPIRPGIAQSLPRPLQTPAQVATRFRQALQP